LVGADLELAAIAAPVYFPLGEVFRPLGPPLFRCAVVDAKEFCQ
jgi:hypothetical protein